MEFIGKLFGGIAIVLIITLGLMSFGLFSSKTFDPKYEQVRRETFEQSKAYRDGMVQELQNMEFQYLQADEAHKKALADIILHRTAAVPPDALTPELNSFIAQLQLLYKGR